MFNWFHKKNEEIHPSTLTKHIYSSQQLLQNANEQDQYNTLCQNDRCNRLARVSCFYTPWPTQTEALNILQHIKDPDVKVVILHPSADGGMPHTRASNIICLPAYYPQENYNHTLHHELIHIDQRKNPKKWHDRLLKDGWAPITEEEARKEIPIEYLQRCRYNPDTIHARFWAWEGRYIPLPLFIREDKPNLREIVVRWWDLEKGVLRIDHPTSLLQKIDKKYHTFASLEHPYELYAYQGEDSIL